MIQQHTVKSFEEELKRLDSTIAQMAGMVESSVANALIALARRDNDLAQAVVAADLGIDQLDNDIDEMVVRLLALRQPMASDLRLAVGVLRMAGDLERIGDYAANVAKRTIALNQLPPVAPISGIPRMGKLVQSILKDVIDAFVERDAQAAVRAWQRDEEVDEMYTSLFRELLTYMMEDPRSITPCTHVLFMAKNVERIGDHATNIAETIHFIVTGSMISAHRPKGDTSSFTTMEAALPSRGEE